MREINDKRVYVYGPGVESVPVGGKITWTRSRRRDLVAPTWGVLQEHGMGVSRPSDLVRAILSAMTLFAVIRTRGRAWLSDRGLEDQPQWREHADFMNGLAEGGFVVLGGPLEGTPDVLLIMRAESAEAISQRLEGDPWTHLELLRILSITPWTVRLGAPPDAT